MSDTSESKAPVYLELTASPAALGNESNAPNQYNVTLSVGGLNGVPSSTTLTAVLKDAAGDIVVGTQNPTFQVYPPFGQGNTQGNTGHTFAPSGGEGIVKLERNITPPFSDTGVVTAITQGQVEVDVYYPFGDYSGNNPYTPGNVIYATVLVRVIQ